MKKGSTKSGKEMEDMVCVGCGTDPCACVGNETCGSGPSGCGSGSCGSGSGCGSGGCGGCSSGYEGCHKGHHKMFLGFGLIGLGVLWYLKNTGTIPAAMFWPIVFVLAGVALLAKKLMMHR